MVRKSPKRTLRVTVRPARPGPADGRRRRRPCARPRRPSSARSWIVAGERLLVADRLDRPVGLDRAVVDAVASWCRWRPLASPRACDERRPRHGGQVADRGTPRRRAARAWPGPTPHSAWTGSGWRKASSSPVPPPRPRARRRRRPGRRVGLAASDASLARNLVGGTPTEHVRDCSSATRRRMAAAISAPAPEQPRRAGHVEEGLVEGDALDQRRERARRPRGRPGWPPRRRRGRRAGRRRAGTAAGPAPTAWPSGCRSAGPRRRPRPPRPAVARPADDDRAARPARAGAAARRDVERVHVDVQDRPRRHGARARGAHARRRPRTRSRMAHHVTRPSASTTMRPDIFDAPAHAVHERDRAPRRRDRPGARGGRSSRSGSRSPRPGPA